jgi:hypothetical protein
MTLLYITNYKLKKKTMVTFFNNIIWYFISNLMQIFIEWQTNIDRKIVLSVSSFMWTNDFSFQKKKKKKKQSLIAILFVFFFFFLTWTGRGPSAQATKHQNLVRWICVGKMDRALRFLVSSHEGTRTLNLLRYFLTSQPWNKIYFWS